MSRKFFTFLQLYAMAMVFMDVSASPAYDFTARSAGCEGGCATAEVGKLEMVTFNPEKIEGVYHNSRGDGIRFVSEATGESRYLGLHTLSGELLMSVNRQSAVAT